MFPHVSEAVMPRAMNKNARGVYAVGQIHGMRNG
jgi:hypothetical protein